MEKTTDRYPRCYWRTPAPDLAVRVEDNVPVAVVVYDPGGVKASELRNVTAALLHEEEKAFPISTEEAAPPRSVVNEPWEWALAEMREDLQRARVADGWLLLATREAWLLERTPGQSPGDFYRNVAEFHRLAVDLVEHGTKAISVVAEVPHTTAARWVREARRRGNPMTLAEAERYVDPDTGASMVSSERTGR